jgi:hypothetical protein
MRAQHHQNEADRLQRRLQRHFDRRDEAEFQQLLYTRRTPSGSPAASPGSLAFDSPSYCEEEDQMDEGE